MTDGELWEWWEDYPHLWKILDSTGFPSCEVDYYALVAFIKRLIKQNSPQGEVSQSHQSTSKADDSSIPDDAGELEKQLDAIIGDSDDFNPILSLIHQQRQRWESRARYQVIEWLETDLNRLDSYNWTIDSLALDTLAAEGKLSDDLKDKRQKIVEDRRAAQALYAILKNYKQQVILVPAQHKEES